MSVLQSKMSEVRYMKRQNLEQESKIIGNYYRDLIRSYGIDCVVYKLNKSNFQIFKDVIDRNTVLRHAYGYEIEPDYSISANMITFFEVENDIFQLNKYGIIPNMDVNFYFDANDFACALATKLGQYKEYKIDETEIVCEVPEFNAETSAAAFPYQLGLGYAEQFKCEMLSGRLSVEISGYQLDKEETVMCHPFEHTDFEVKFPVNEYIAKSFQHKLVNDDYIDSQIFLTYKVQKIATSKTDVKYVLTGKVHGAILFYDMSQIGKYVEKIHPEVGDLVTIDFPDEKNREQYEITEAIDKQMTSDGINPLMHKYIWKCKARRYVNTYEDAEENEANERVEEQAKYDKVVSEEIAKKISLYDDLQDAAYGGYDNHIETHDKQVVNPDKKQYYDFIDDGTALDILIFETGSKLMTNGYDLLFMDATADHNVTRLTTVDNLRGIDNKALAEQNLRYLKATDAELVFVNIEGQSFRVAEDEVATQGELEVCLNSLFDKTLDSDGNINNEGDCFYKFKGCRTLLWSTAEHLYCKLGTGKLYKLA